MHPNLLLLLAFHTFLFISWGNALFLPTPTVAVQQNATRSVLKCIINSNIYSKTKKPVLG